MKSLALSLTHASDIATYNLHSCYSQFGILAGRHHFTDYWARDGFFASFGSLAIGDQEIVAKNGRIISHINPEKSSQFRFKAKSIAIALRQRLWNGKYFSDWDDDRPGTTLETNTPAYSWGCIL